MNLNTLPSHGAHGAHGAHGEVQNNKHIALPQGWGPQLKFNSKPCHRKGRYKQQVSDVKCQVLFLHMLL